MEEQIYKILHANVSIIDINTWVSGIKKNRFEIISKEITAHVFEFVEWLRSGAVMQEDESEHRYIEESRKTDEEIYNYWLTEVKR